MNHQKSGPKKTVLVFAFAAALLLTGCRSPLAADPVAEPLYFVQITDTHLGVAGHDRVATQLVDMINALPMPISCVVHTGDLSADQLDRPEATAPGLAALRRVKVPVHFVAGNHDIIEKRPAETLAAWTNSVGPLCGRAEYQGVIFLFVYMDAAVRGSRVPGFDPMEWLGRELGKSAGKPVLVFFHTPPMADFYGNQWHAGWPEHVRDRWLTLVRSANVKAAIGGHFHRDELQWMGDVPVYVAPPAARFWGRQPSFRIYEYRNGRLGYRTCYIEEPRQTAPPAERRRE
jgi:3',5'-cyclic AMP phosphodiesterase CpdA